jgi:hypothetical protein
MMPKKKENYWTLIAVIGVPIVTFIAGMALNAFTIAEKLATKPYVDDRFLESKKYTDEKTVQALKDAIEHSDTNRREILLRMEAMSSDLKTNNAVLGTKVDNNSKSLQDLRDMLVERRNRH